MYTTKITENETLLGFILGEMPHPKKQCLSEYEIVPAVLFRLDENNVIVKVLNPVGGYRYCHKHRRETGWVTVSNIENDPHEAISNSREYLCNIKNTKE